MKTIGAKELRLHLDKVLDRVLKGEEIIVRHRFKGPVRLSMVHESQMAKQSAKLAGLQAFDAAKKKPSPYSPRASLKELYDQSITDKHARP